MAMASSWKDFLKEKRSPPVLDSRKRGDIARLLQGGAVFDAPMKEYTSIRVGGPADCVATPMSLDILKELLLYLRQEKIPYTLLGRGTNLLVKDGGIRGVTIRLNEGLRRWRREEETVLFAESGLSLAQLVKWGMAWGLEGCEGLAGIPGSLGGAIRMNAGTREGEIGDCVVKVGIIDEHGTFSERERDEMEFSYRHSALPKGAVIVSSVLNLRAGDPTKVREKTMTLLDHRRKTQPLALPTAGSIFKNPHGGPPAGKLIEDCGLKGVRVRGARVSDVHANFIVNVGSASAKDVLSLVGLVRERVYELRGIKLEPEIVVVGEDREGAPGNEEKQDSQPPAANVPHRG